MRESVVDVVELQNRDFDWFDKKRRNSCRYRVYTDVSVTKVKVKEDGSCCYNVIFRNESFQRFHSDSIQMAVKGNRLYFRGVEKGLKLSGNSRGTYKVNRYTRTANSLVSKFVGDYNLKLDEEYHLYYIECQEESV